MSTVRSAAIGLSYAYLTSLPVLLGALFGQQFVDARRYGGTVAQSLAEGAANYGVGHRYAEIAAFGYGGKFANSSGFAYFPLFPLLSSAVSAATGAATGIALLVVAGISFAATLTAFRAYLQARLPDESEQRLDYSLVAFGLWPATFFFRMAYPEPLFTLLAILALFCIERRWLWRSAAIAGLASACRPVGVALVLPVAIFAWSAGGSRCKRAAQATLAAVMACAGLLAYMIYQQHVCGNALQFVDAQSYWRVRPAVPPLDRALALAWCEPVVHLFSRSSEIYWGIREPHRVLALSFLGANAPLFLVVVGGIAFGARRGWLNRYELSLSFGLLAIPYLTRAYEMGMSGMGRFAAVAFPFYLVAGRVLWSMPRPMAASLLAIAAVFLFVYSSFVVAGFSLG